MFQPLHLPGLDILHLRRIIHIITFHRADINFTIALGREDDIVADLDFITEAIKHTRRRSNAAFLRIWISLNVLVLKGIPVCIDQTEIAHFMPANSDHITFEEQIIILSMNSPDFLFFVCHNHIPLFYCSFLT